MGVLSGISGETKRAVMGVGFFAAGLFLTLAYFRSAGIAGDNVYEFLGGLLGIGYFLLPLVCFILAVHALRESERSFTPLKFVAGGIVILAGLGFIDIVSGRGGLLGALLSAPIVGLFDMYAALILLGGLALVSLLILLEGRIALEPFSILLSLLKKFGQGLLTLVQGETIPVVGGIETELAEEENAAPDVYGYDEKLGSGVEEEAEKETATKRRRLETIHTELRRAYTPPPFSLLERDRGKPGVGDIKASANIIKRTLQNFGIVVELDEISIGPSFTRYAIKPAEGVRLQKIVALQNNLELALAAHPVRIEAPIPGKSLVGIEVPNSAKVTVGLGTLLEAPQFKESQKPLLVALGRDIAGGSHFGNLGRMPHLLIAGATGSGKSVSIHAAINSLLYRCGPEQLRFIMIDPKRVELTLYRSLPHLLTPVITDAKRAIMALRWGAKEMERRYTMLEEHRVRDVESYHQNILAPKLEKLRRKVGAPTEASGLSESEEMPDAMPYIVIVIDELADIMSTYPRELEAAVVRLAQMSRAVGIHLILSTQRPSVNVITGLIKANIPARIALQVASQVDSRTILDQSGAEKLLGSGDMLYSSGDAKPVRLQSAYLGETEVKKVVEYIAQHNEAQLPIEIGAVAGDGSPSISLGANVGMFGDEEEVDDEMYEAAKAAIIEAGKASTSYIQRKLRLGYARAARIMDMLEERGVIGPQDGAKPREILGQPTTSTTRTTEIEET